jgi:hypothetical protein
MLAGARAIVPSQIAWAKTASLGLGAAPEDRLHDLD